MYRLQNFGHNSLNSFLSDFYTELLNLNLLHFIRFLFGYFGCKSIVKILNNTLINMHFLRSWNKFVNVVHFQKCSNTQHIC